MPWAEETKIGLVKEGAKFVPGGDLAGLAAIRVYARVDDEWRDPIVEHGAMVPDPSEFFSRVGEFIEPALDNALRLVKKRGVGDPDVVLVAGGSSALPPVGERLAEAFPSAEIVLSVRPKECVVLGAGIREIYMGATAPLRIVLPEAGTVATTVARIGYLVPQGTRAMFREIWDAGIPIPKEGLAQLLRLPRLHRDASIQILENRGLNDDISDAGKDVETIREFTMGEIAPAEMKDEELGRSAVEVRLSEENEISLAIVPDVTERPFGTGI